MSARRDGERLPVPARRGRPPRIAFAGDRDIAVRVLDHLLAQDVQPLALLVSDEVRATHATQLRARLPALPESHVLRGGAFRSPEGMELLRTLDLDFVVGVHFPYLVPEDVLAIPREGVLNLHPALLPWNRGWHTPSWAILEGTPAGATLHFMDAGVDTGDIVHQRELAVSPADTADSLYRRLKDLELDVFREAWPALAAGTYRRQPQAGAVGSAHRRRELFDETVQRLDLDAPTTAGELLRRLRGLTTNTLAEAAWFEAGGVRWRVQVRIESEPGAPPLHRPPAVAGAARNAHE